MNNLRNYPYRATGDKRERALAESRIKNVTVRKLFGRFNYDVDFTNKDNVSILIAPNGCGKTTIFELISFCHGKVNEEVTEKLLAIPYEYFKLTTNNYVIEISDCGIPKLENSSGLDTVDDGDEDYRSIELNRKIKKGLIRLKKYTYSTLNEEKREISFYMYCDSRPKISRDYNDWDETDEDYEERELESVKLIDASTDNFVNALTNPVDINKKIRLIVGRKPCVNVNFIATNRLENTNLLHGPEVNSGNVLRAVISNLRGTIIRHTRNYNITTDEAKVKLVKSYVSIKLTNKRPPNFEQFKKRWDNYSQNMRKFAEFGLVYDSSPLDLGKNMEETYNEKSEFLETYLDVFEPTLEELFPIYKKMKLFEDIFNSRNAATGKRIRMKDFTTPQSGSGIYMGDTLLNPEMLSSGEKHDLVMFYYLIFKSQINTTFLIDEPEISLHIQWQEEYLDRLLEICKMNGCQAIVATHSPHIVNGHYELYADKQVSVDEN